jgi:hypothetical protein
MVDWPMVVEKRLLEAGTEKTACASIPCVHCEIVVGMVWPSSVKDM